ncbi:MAG: hypothetical protein ACRDA3_10785 [Peptostreptococcaceae bacterium]
MSSYVRIIYDRLDFIEFKQNILLLKQPQHKASVFMELTLDDFLKIRDHTQEVEATIVGGGTYTLDKFEKKLFEICPSLKSYTSSSTLVAKSLLSRNAFDSLFIASN